MALRCSACSAGLNRRVGSGKGSFISDPVQPSAGSLCDPPPSIETRALSGAGPGQTQAHAQAPGLAARRQSSQRSRRERGSRARYLDVVSSLTRPARAQRRKRR